MRKFSKVVARVVKARVIARVVNDLDTYILPEDEKKTFCTHCGRKVKIPGIANLLPGTVLKCRVCDTCFRIGNKWELVIVV